jgi:hypothetical protein
MAVDRLQPSKGDILIRKKTPDSPIEYLLYEGPGDWSSNEKTWILKLEKCTIQLPDQGNPSTHRSSGMLFQILMVWDPNEGFKQMQSGGQLTRQLELSSSGGLGRGGTTPDENNIAMAFFHRAPPMGATFLTVDFWKSTYLDDVYTKLIVLGVMDFPVSTDTTVRSVSTWYRDSGLWKQEGPILTTTRANLVHTFVAHSIE